MKRSLRKLFSIISTTLLVLLLLGGSRMTGAVAEPPFMSQKGAELQATLNKASRFYEEQNMADSALYYFTNLAACYSPEFSDAEKEVCVKALLGKWVVLFSYYYDYPQAFETLLRARDICDENGISVPRVDVSMAGMYQSLALASGEKALNDSAKYYYRRAITSSLTPRHYGTADLAFTNGIQIAIETGDHPEAEYLWKKYSTLPPAKDNIRRTFNHAMYKAYSTARRGDLKSAVSLMDRAVAAIPDTSIYHRMLIVGMLFSARLSEEAGNFPTAVSSIRSTLDVSERLGILDAQAECYSLLSEIMGRTGNPALKKEYLLKSIALRDSTSYHRNLLKVDELRYLYAAGKASAKLARVEADRRLKGTVLIFLTIFIVIAATSIIMIWRKNKKLKEQMRALYLRSVESLSPEVAPCVPSVQEGSEMKYQGSNLTDEARDTLASEIERFMKSSRDIFSSDFSVARLAAALNSNPKYVSQTINANFGCNFNAYVNRYRVREACRRMNTDASWRRLTIEGAASEVGFKSRTPFINAFKRETGLTPSEYKKQAELAKKQA